MNKNEVVYLNNHRCSILLEYRNVLHKMTQNKDLTFVQRSVSKLLINDMCAKYQKLCVKESHNYVGFKNEF